MDRINKSIRNRNGAILERRSYTTCQVNIKDKRVGWLFILWVSRWMRFGRLYHNYPLGMIVCVEKDVAKYIILNTTVFYFLIYLYLCYSFSNDAMLLAGGQYHILQVDLHVSPESQTIWIVNPYSVYTRFWRNIRPIDVYTGKFHIGTKLQFDSTKNYND